MGIYQPKGPGETGNPEEQHRQDSARPRCHHDARERDTRHVLRPAAQTPALRQQEQHAIHHP